MPLKRSEKLCMRRLEETSGVGQVSNDAACRASEGLVGILVEFWWDTVEIALI